MWRAIYLAKAPHFSKRIRIVMSWMLDLTFGIDIPEFTPERYPTADAPTTSGMRAG